MRFFNSIKKIIILAVTLFSISAFYSTNINAQESGGGGSSTDQLLAKIYAVLQQIDKNVTTIGTSLVEYILNWTNPDTSDEPKNSVSAYTQTLGNNIQVQNGLDKDQAGVGIQKELLNDLFLGVTNLPTVNNLTFISLLKIPYSLPGAKPATKQNPPNPAYAFVKNAAGLNMTHFPPWGGKLNANKPVSDQQSYADYYSIVMSIESYDAYLLSEFYIDYFVNKTPLTQQQVTMINQSTQTDWFKQLASQPLGYVLRQILLYESQVFVVLTELLQTNKKMLAAQAMNNTLLILSNGMNEKILFQKSANLPITP